MGAALGLCPGLKQSVLGFSGFDPRANIRRPRTAKPQPAILWSEWRRLSAPGRHMRRREFIAILGGAVAWPLAGHAQQPGRLWRIGILETTPLDLNNLNIDALRKGLRDRGYVEGKNLVIDYRSADGRAERFPALGDRVLLFGVTITFFALVFGSINILIQRLITHLGRPSRDQAVEP